MTDAVVSGRELNRRVTRLMTPGIVLANVVGAAVVFVFLLFLLPLHGSHDAHTQRSVDTIAFIAYLGVAVVIGRLWSVRQARPVQEWLESGAPATAEDRRQVLRQPLLQMRVNATLWIAAAVLFGILNAYWDLGEACDIASTIALGGFTTCVIAYLLAERLMRPVVTRAMAGTDEPPPVLLGVRTRLLVAWGVGSAIPLIGITYGLLAPSTGDPLSTGGVLFLAAVGVVIGFASIAAAAGAVSDPVRSVAHALRQVGEGRLDCEVPVYDASEVGRLQSGFNAMVAGLRERERLRDLFGRQVGDEVARLSLERGVELGGETRDVAVLFVDIVGSTALAASTEPQEVVRRLNEFFAAVVDVVTQHGGWVNKFEGDAALCVFGAPLPLPDARLDALAAARELAARLTALDVDAGIGVTAGDVVAGNVGTEKRFEYTVIGDPVNAAARISELAKSERGRVLADVAVVRSVGAEESRCWEPRETVVLRGRAQPTTLAAPTSVAS